MIVPVVSESWPESELIRVAPASVIAPKTPLLPAMLRSAPPLATPVPLSVRGSLPVPPPPPAIPPPAPARTAVPLAGVAGD